MRIVLTSPTKAYLENFNNQLDNLKHALTYTDKKIQFEISKAKKSRFLLYKLGEERYQEHLQDLQSKLKPCLLNEDENGYWVYSGLAHKISKHFNSPLEITYSLPERQLIPWAKTPRTPRPYQTQAFELLLEGAKLGPAAIEHGTGLGKTTTAMMAIKHLGLKTVMMVPSTSIAKQALKDFQEYLGVKYVGLYGAGKKEFKKLITIAIDDSLSRVEPGSEAWEAFSKAMVFVADESHLTPAKTLKKVCFDLMANAPYRLFFSGTQLRNDGLDLVLEGITGPIVHRMSVREGVDQGWLSKPVFTMMSVGRNDDFESDDANRMTRNHLYYNPRVMVKAADIINKSVTLLHKRVLVLIEEVEHFSILFPLLKVKSGFAHGPLNAENKPKVPPPFWESNPTALVDQFDAGKLNVLVGTSCVSTGTDIKSAQVIVRLKGGISEIEVRQDVGRGTRLFEGKTDCQVIDFDVQDVPILHRHSKVRKSIYNEIYGPVRAV